MGSAMGDVTLADLDKGQAVIGERISSMKADIDNKHKQNRDSIHSINGRLDILTNQMWLLKLKIVGYTSGAGVLTGVLLKLLDHFWK